MKLLQLVSLFLIFLYSCDEPNKDLSKMKDYEGPIIEVTNVETLYSDSARVRVKLNAPVQWEYKSGDRDFPKGIIINFFDENGKNSAQLTANRGKFNKEKNLYTALGNVIVKNLLEQKKLKDIQIKKSVFLGVLFG